MNERYPQLKEKTRAHFDEAEKIYREKEEEYKRLRLPITLVKMAGVGVANFFIYYKQFNLEWAKYQQEFKNHLNLPL
jgi:hypothetical protein